MWGEAPGTQRQRHLEASNDGASMTRVRDPEILSVTRMHCYYV